MREWEQLIKEREPETQQILDVRIRREVLEEERIAGLRSKFLELVNHSGLMGFLDARGESIVLAKGDYEQESASLTLSFKGSIILSEDGQNDVIFRHRPSNDVKNRPEGFFRNNVNLMKVLRQNKKFRYLTADVVDQFVEKGIRDLK